MKNKKCEHIWYVIRFGESIGLAIVKCGVCNIIKWINLKEIERI